MATNDSVHARTLASRPKFSLFVKLFLASFSALYFELVVIRFLSSEIRVFAYLKNLALIASFFGIGLGMIAGAPTRKLIRHFPLMAAVLFSLIAFASPFGLTHLAFPTGDYILPGDIPRAFMSHAIFWALLVAIKYLLVVPAILYLIIKLFMVLGGFVGEYLSNMEPLRGYGVNLAGSLAGVVVFMILSFLGTSPPVWVLLGFSALIPFFPNRKALVLFALTAIVIVIPLRGTHWSPYYRITLREIPPPQGWNRASGYFLDVNHDYHQKMLDLSPEFTNRFPDSEPNRSSLATYELPYRIVPHPGSVLVVGAGTGNDVAAALRHGAPHVDAVEIDPVILGIGRKYHPEKPYSSARVSVFVNDARAFFKQTKQKYNLIVFGYLDSHTLLSSLSSIRLDNYVYTLESFREAKNLLTPGGTLVLSFSSGTSFLGDRMFATLSRAFGSPPLAYFTAYDTTGVVYVEGGDANAEPITEFPEISRQFRSNESQTLLATDRWPFLYLKSRTIPLSMVVVFLPFLYMALVLLQKNTALRGLACRGDLHFFFLGAGFMLLETKGVTEMSLLFGSTWVVNAVVISAFLLMGLLANTVIEFRPLSHAFAYLFLFVLLGVGLFVPYSLLDGLDGMTKVVAACAVVGLPVFFSGLVFSRSYRGVESPSRALGVNLLGAVVGGTLENSVMVGGTPVLGVLAIVLYVGSVISIIRPGLVFERKITS